MLSYRRSSAPPSTALPANWSGSGYGSGTNGYGFVESSPSYTSVSSMSAASDDYYYKDKPRNRKRSSDLGDILAQPWSLLSIFAVLMLCWSMHSRAQRAWLLRELQVQSFQEAISVFHEMRRGHRDVSHELDYHYNANERLEERDSAWKSMVANLINATRRESYRAVVDK